MYFHQIFFQVPLLINFYEEHLNFKKCKSSFNLFTEVVAKYRERIERLENDIEEIMTQEKEEKEMRIVEQKMNRAELLVTNKNEDANRPQRTWFQSKEERKQEAGM